MSKIQALRKEDLREAPATPGITRYLAFEGEGYLVLRSRAEPGVVSAWHHHGDYDVYGFIIAGSERFEFGPQGKEAILVHKGEFFHVPPHTVHRDVNPSPDEGQEAVLFLRGSGPVVINVDGPDEA
jgi:quercetin dioxygenase-like cupin family protein